MRISDWSSDVCSSDLRGLARFRAGNYGAALPDLDEAVRLLPASRDAVYLRGRVNDVLGKEGAALADFGRALVLAPGDGEAHVSRGLVRHERGDVAAALADYDRAIAAQPDLVWAMAQKGRALIDLGRHNEEIGRASRRERVCKYG